MAPAGRDAMATPMIRLTDAAGAVLREAAVDAGGVLRIAISEQFEHDLRFDMRRAGDLEVDCDGVTILLDPASADRADGLVIDFVSGPAGSGLTIDNPNGPGTAGD